MKQPICQTVLLTSRYRKIIQTERTHESGVTLGSRR